MEIKTRHGFKINIPPMKSGIRKNNLKHILTERGSSATWLHKKLKDHEIYVCYETVKRWVRDEHLPNNDRTILAICEILGVDLFELGIKLRNTHERGLEDFAEGCEDDKL